ncbi:MAG: hypothetical protein WC323_00760 [Patescibacteria group bacterium]
MRQGASLETISHFIETMFLLVEKYEMEHKKSGIVIKFEDIRAKVPAEYQEALELGWRKVAGF